MTAGVTRPPRLVPARVRAVVFDLDGTLVDSYVAITSAVNHARSAYGLEPLATEVVRATVGRGLECLLADLLGPDRVEDGVRLFREHYAEVFLDHTVALAGARETLAALDGAGLALGVASNKPARFTRPILERLDLARHVRAVHGPDTAGATKPDPAMIRRVLDELACTPEAAVYVGDMMLDIRSAAAAGLPVVLVRGGSSPDADLVASGEVLLPRLADLVALLHPNRREIPAP